jgi:hypothetical protein
MVAYSFDADATDSDIPAQTLTFSLVGAPSGASINPSTGVFNWTPTEAQGPGVYPFTVRVSDGVANTDQSITLTVREVNLPPDLSNPGNKSIDELTLLSFTLSASDPDIPANTLTYTISSGSQSGMTLDSSTGAFSWTPTEAQGPGTYPVTFRVTDNGTPQLYDEKTIEITVNEVNTAPVLTDPENKTVDELTTLNFTLSATDLDLPANTLTYSISSGSVTGMNLNSSTGVFIWTPSEAQGPGTYPVTFKVTDNGTPQLSDEKTITITVNEVNVAPTLTGVPVSATIDEMAPYSFDANATDEDIPVQTLTFSLIGAPSGAAINETTGVFSWTPSEIQGPGVYTFTVRVSDGIANTDQSITLTVREVNLPPDLVNPGNKSVAWGNTLSFTLSATDPDIPANILTFSISSGSLFGMSLNPSTGAFSWTPTSAQIGTHSVTFRVTDNGSPNLYDEETITITVGKRATQLVYNGDASAQYSDPATLSATLTDALTGNPLSDETISFTLGSQSTSAVTNGSGVASANLIITQAPGNYTVGSAFTGDAYYLPSNDSDPFIINKEDARVTYTGPVFVTTASETATSVVVPLSATVQDITAVSPGTDANAGDIRNATVTFLANNAAIAGCSNLPVNLVNSLDTKTGTAGCNLTATVGNYTITVVVGGYYKNDDQAQDPASLEVAPGGGTNFITGGGYVGMTSSAGQYPAASGTKMNFGFNVKYNKAKTNLQGHVNIIYRNAGHVYQIKSNSITSLTVNLGPNGNPPSTATFISKANLTDVTNPLAPINLGGGNTLQMAMLDNGEPGSTDTIGFTLTNGGALLFSSNWGGTKTTQKVLVGGNLVVH